jgi:hypothetical protein
LELFDMELAVIKVVPSSGICASTVAANAIERTKITLETRGIVFMAPLLFLKKEVCWILTLTGS